MKPPVLSSASRTATYWMPFPNWPAAPAFLPAAYAGLVKAVEQQLVSGDESIVVLNTGNGLKDVAGAMQAVDRAGTKPFYVEPDIKSLQQVVADWSIT